MTIADYAIADALCIKRDSNAIVPELNSRIRIQWTIDGYPGDFDNVTVVAISEYTMTIRVGWISDFPMLMVARKWIRNFDEFGRPFVREMECVPINYRD